MEIPGKLALTGASLFFPIYAFCGSLTSIVGVTTSGVVGSPTDNPACSASNTTGAPLTVANCTVFSLTNPANSNPESYTYSGYATASYDSLGTSSSVSVVNTDLSDGSLGASGYARLIDNLVTSLPSTDMIAFVFNVDGSSTTPSGLQKASMVLTLGFNYGDDVPYFWQFGSSNYSGDVVSYAYPVSLFEDYAYFVSMASQTLVTNQTSTAYNASGSVNFSDTAALIGVGVWNASGVFQPDAVVGSAGNSGDFPVLDVTEVSGITPEPATYILTGAGLGLLMLLRRRAKMA